MIRYSRCRAPGKAVRVLTDFPEMMGSNPVKCKEKFTVINKRQIFKGLPNKSRIHREKLIYILYIASNVTLNLMDF